jgi:hypothetical protein
MAGTSPAMTETRTPPPTFPLRKRFGYDIERIGLFADLGTALVTVGIMDNGVAQAPPNKLPSDDDIFGANLPDAALEAAATATPGMASSFPNAPTVNILVICCNFD